MKAVAASLALGLLAAGAAARDKPVSGANFTVSKETTHVTGPLDKDGRIDYVTALNDRLGKGVTPDTNANVVIWRVFGPKPEGGNGMPAEFFKRLGIDEPPEAGEYFVDVWRFARDQLEIDDPELRQEIDGQLGRAARRPWTAEDYPYVADWLKAVRQPLDRLGEGMKRPHYYNPLTPPREADGTANLLSALLPAVQKCRATASALTARAMLRLGEGKPDEAWQDLLACHRLGRHLAHGATLIEGLVGIAIEAIAQRADVALLERPELTAKVLQGYLRDLQALPPMPGVADYVDLAERFTFLDTVMMADRHGLRFVSELMGPVDATLPEGPLGNIDWDPALRKANALYDRLAAATRPDTRAAREKQFKEIESYMKDLKSGLVQFGDVFKALQNKGASPTARGKLAGDLLIGLMLPALWKLQQASDRCEQGQRNLHVAFALAAYLRDNGVYPKTLDALAPKYLAKIPDDLFAGKPLVYKPSAEGYQLSSVGPNGTDEGGRSRGDDPPGDDIAVRVPQPKK